MRKSAALLAMMALSACASGSGSGPILVNTGSLSIPERSRPAPAPAPSATPTIQREAGVGDIVGARASNLLRRFGKARIDLAEGDVRKLQFASNTCVLDIYLYPQSTGSEPLAAYVEARTRNTGARIESQGCIREIEAR